MTRHLLDTDIISNAVRPQPSAPLLNRMEAKRGEELSVASLTVAEVQRGILELPNGRKGGCLEAGSRARKNPKR